MWPIDEIAEQRIRQAMERGEFDNLPGAGKPLKLDDDSLIPEELRAAYRLLKNAGFLPPEAHTLREIREIEALLMKVTEPEERDRRLRRLQLLQLRLAESRGGSLDLPGLEQYRDKLIDSFGAPDEI
jgi:hypothetical protein